TRAFPVHAQVPIAPATSARPARTNAWPALVALLLVAALGGALAAYLLTRGDSSKPVAVPQPKVTTIVRTVTKPSGQTTTVEQPVTTAPAAGAPASGASGQALNDQGYAKMRAGDYSGALPLLQQAVRKLQGVGFPYEAYANYNLGYALLQLGQCSEAVPYLERAKQLEPQRPEPKQA